MFLFALSLFASFNCAISLLLFLFFLQHPLTVVYENIAFVSADSAFLCGILTIGYGIKVSAWIYNKENHTYAFILYLSLEYCSFKMIPFFFAHFCIVFCHTNFSSRYSWITRRAKYVVFLKKQTKKWTALQFRMLEYIWLCLIQLFLKVLCSLEKVWEKKHLFFFDFGVQAHNLVCNRNEWIFLNFLFSTHNLC